MFTLVAVSPSTMMDVFCNRFPLVATNLLSLLDNTSLLNCKESNRELNNFIKNEKLVWLRIIRLYKGNIIGFEDSWKKTIEKDSVDNIKQLALATQNFFKYEPRCLNQWHPLFIVAAEGCFELCKHVLDKTGENNPSIVNHIPILIITGYTALHFSAEIGRLDLAKLIMNRIEDKNPIDSHKNTCLHFAAIRGDIALYKFFMNYAEDNMPDNFMGLKPYHLAAYCGNLKVFELVLKNLEDKNPPTTTGNDLGVTPLHYAAQNGHVNVISYILKYAREKNPQKRDGITPLHVAAYRGHLEACRVLMEAASDKEPTTRSGLPKPVFYAMQNNHEKVVNYITEYLRKDNLQRNEGWLTRVQKKFSFGWLWGSPVMGLA